MQTDPKRDTSSIVNINTELPIHTTLTYMSYLRSVMLNCLGQYHMLAEIHSYMSFGDSLKSCNITSSCLNLIFLMRLHAHTPGILESCSDCQRAERRGQRTWCDSDLRSREHEQCSY